MAREPACGGGGLTARGYAAVRAGRKPPRRQYSHSPLITNPTGASENSAILPAPGPEQMGVPLIAAQLFIVCR